LVDENKRKSKPFDRWMERDMISNTLSWCHLWLQSALIVW